MADKIIQGVDILDLLNLVYGRNKMYQAILLQNVETIMDKESPEFKKIRKSILDSFNNYTREILRAIFGNDLEEIRRND
jgi:hypothetical protein